MMFRWLPFVRSLPLFCVAVASPALAAPREPQKWSPTGKWGVDFGEDGCVASRSFESGGKEVVLGFRPLPTTDSISVMLQAEGKIGNYEFHQAKVHFGNHPTDVEVMMVRPSSKQGYGVHRFGVSRLELAELESSQRLTVETPRMKIDLPVTGLTPVLGILDQCVSGLLERIGFNKEAQARIASFPEGKQSMASYASNDDYPTSALRRGAVGEIEARMTIAINGRPSDCVIVRSSGHEDLDQVTCAIFIKRARFKPGIDREGKAMSSPYFVTMRWMMP